MAAALAAQGVSQTIVHTGQHYDAQMSGVFFKELGLPEPDVNLEVGSGSHAVQTAQIMQRFEPVVLERKPDLVVVYGDVNSTVAAALVCAKLMIPVAHVEAGLRSGDRSMPEEINRLLTDQLADLLFTPSPDGNDNLLREGIPPEKIKLVGNVMIDTLVRLLPQAEGRWPQLETEFPPGRFRPGDPAPSLQRGRPGAVEADCWKSWAGSGRRLSVLFPVHPRTRQAILDGGLEVPETIRLLEPLGYLDFLALEKHAAVVITDSGGIQEETTYLGVPCLTLRTHHRAPHHHHPGDEHPDRRGPGAAAARTRAHPGWQGQERADSAPLGWACLGEDRQGNPALGKKNRPPWTAAGAKVPQLT